MCAFSNDLGRCEQSCKVDFLPNFATSAGLVGLRVCGKFTEVNQPKGRGCDIVMLMQSDFAVLLKAHHSSGAATFEGRQTKTQHPPCQQVQTDQISPQRVSLSTLKDFSADVNNYWGKEIDI